MITASLRLPKSLLDWVREQSAAKHLRPSGLIRQWSSNAGTPEGPQLSRNSPPGWTGSNVRCSPTPEHPDGGRATVDGHHGRGSPTGDETIRSATVTAAGARCGGGGGGDLPHVQGLDRVAVAG